MFGVFPSILIGILAAEIATYHSSLFLFFHEYSYFWFIVDYFLCSSEVSEGGGTERRSEINRNSGAWCSNFWQINFRAPPEQRPTIDNLPKTLGLLPSSTFGHHTTREPDGSYQISISSSDRQTAATLPSVPLLPSLFWYSCCFPSLVSPDQTHENGKWPMTHAPFPHRSPYLKKENLYIFCMFQCQIFFLFS